MKILVITQYFYPETFRVNTLCQELTARGHQVTVLTGYPQYPQGKIYEGYGFGKPYERVWNGIQICRVNMQPRGKTPLGLLRNCLSFVRHGNRWVRKCAVCYDAVYVFGVSPVTVGLVGVTYHKKFGTPLYFHVQDLWPESVEVVLGLRNRAVLYVLNKIVDRIYGASHKILCTSRAFVEHIAERGVPREKLIFLPQFCAEPQLEGVARPEYYDRDYFNIVFAGNLGDAQGLDMLVDAAARMRGRHIRWYLVGDGRARARLEQRVREKRLEQDVFFIGRVSEQEANRYIHFADAAYLSFMDDPLFDMTLPAKLQSYMACGTPILAAAGGESRQVVERSGCGCAFARSAAALSGMALQFVTRYERLWEMGQKGREYYLRHYSPEVVMAQLEAILAQQEEEV